MSKPAESDIAHGTYGGAQAHRRRGETPCDDCKAAQAAYQRAYRDTTSTRDARRDRYARRRVLRALREADPIFYRRLYRAAAAEWERANPKETP